MSWRDNIVDMGGRSESRRDPTERDRPRPVLGQAKCTCTEYRQKVNPQTGRCAQCFKVIEKKEPTE